MDENKRDELLRECSKCRERMEREYSNVDYIVCSYKCPIGMALHELEKEEWGKIDWNDSRYEAYYRH